MLRKDIINAGNKILRSLEESGVFFVIQSFFTKEKGMSGEEILSSYQHYMHETKSFSDTENKIVEIFGLKDLQEPGFWSFLVTSEEKRSPAVHEIYQRLRFVSEHLPKLVRLLHRSVDDIKEKQQTEEKTDEAVLTAILIEDDSVSSTKRVIIALEAIEGLYEAASQILNIEPQSLSVASCDSGSDKSFDLLGAAKAIACVKDIILSFWDKVIFFHENKANKQLEVIANTLPILSELSDMKKNGKIEPEKAELIKRQIISSIEKFSDAGVTIPEINSRTIFNPRQLMQPKRKLLVAPSVSAKEDTKTEEILLEEETDIDDPEFQKYMEKMAKKFLKRRNDETDK